MCIVVSWEVEISVGGVFEGGVCGDFVMVFEEKYGLNFVVYIVHAPQ